MLKLLNPLDESILHVSGDDPIGIIISHKQKVYSPRKWR